MNEQDRIHDGRTPGGNQPLYAMGDIHRKASGNMTNNIWTYSHPYLICYAGGLYLDSLIDAHDRADKVLICPIAVFSG